MWNMTDVLPFTTGIFHVSISFYSLVILIWLDPATGPWRENRQLKRRQVPTYAPVLMNSKLKHLRLVWHHQLKGGSLKAFSSRSAPKRNQLYFITPDDPQPVCMKELRISEVVLHPRGEKKKSWLWSKGYHWLLVFSEIFIVEATGSFYLVGIWCHDDINNSQSLGSTFPQRAVCREEQKYWQNPEGSWQG